jgi:cyclic beta-1,2-glucan synthetase
MMMDVSNKKHPSEMTFDTFVDKLVEHTKSFQPQSDGYCVVEQTKDHLKNLEKAFKYFSKMSDKKRIASSGVEWFLDNYYVIQKAVELIRDDLPRNFFNKLPSLNKNSQTPRIYHVARNMIAHYQVEIVREDLFEFLRAYQEFVPLKMSELWALPLMLRLTLIEILSGTIFDLIENQTNIKETRNIEFPDINTDEIIARSIRTLLCFDRINWKEIFENHSKVDTILRNDPDNTYGDMDFTTRDQYRKKIEHLAEKSQFEEIEIAQKAIALAEVDNPKNDKARHVGYFLMGDGEEQLKSAVGFKYVLFDKLRKFFFDHNTLFYLGGIVFITLLVLTLLILVSRWLKASSWQLVVIGILSLIPASSVAVNLINSILTAILPPRILPKMDFSKRVPRHYRSLVVIPALLTNQEEIDFLLQQLELHYLANNDRNIGFVLLSDFSDADQETMPEDEELLDLAIKRINKLNQRYRGDNGRRPFYLFHRRRQWNPKEGTWMGWERKRGKLADFNSYLLEDFEECFDTIIGELDFMSRVRFVITVDADTVLPRDSANTLIATMAHPLNQAEFSEETADVKSGYTILQPRTEVKPTSVIKSLFTRVFAGDLGLDLYTRAVSDVYQDLFGEGIYVGKGIYDVEAFHRSLEGKVPDNALLSHDLFEGLLGRAGLVSDVVLFEEYPPNYASEVNRLHRWVRGDWQLFPWLLPSVPKRAGESGPNPFSIIALWKILDNLRRSMLSPTTLISLLMGWLIFQERAWIWTIVLLFISAFPLFYNIIASLSSRFLVGTETNIIKNIQTAFCRWLLWLIFLPYESLIMSDGIITTLIRVYISHKRLLQWQTSAHTIRLFGKQRKLGTIWQRMIGAPLVSIALAVLIYLFNANAFWLSFPLILLWAISPQIAYWISLEQEEDHKNELGDSDFQKLRRTARRTWFYFEHFIGPEDHWLPPDHFQEDPKGVVAHRTSPTNIGLLMLSSVAAYDFGFIGVLDFIYRMSYTFETLDGLEKYRGHLFNWYDTRNLETLAPRYVSTVDSGNYAASLIGLYQTLQEIPNHTVCPNTLFQGAFDSLDVFCSIVNTINNKELDHVVRPLYDHCRKIQQDINQKPLADTRLMILLADIEKQLFDPMNVLIKTILTTEKTLDPDVMKDIRDCSDAVFQHLQNIKQQIEILAPWMKSWRSRPEFLDDMETSPLNEIFKIWYEDRSLCTQLSDVPTLCDQTIKNIEKFLSKENGSEFSALTNEHSQTLKAWLRDFISVLEKSKENVNKLFNQITALTEKIDFSLDRMEFDFLFDEQQKVFFLGYQVASGRMDKNHYDLLASEARTASLFAISQNEVPRSHWLHMSRSFTDIGGVPTLISWNGSMFEYLMPNLFTRTYPETLLHQTNKGVVQAQIDYGKEKKVPWGISESSYYRFDQADNYQYKGFGVPSLGRKRGLANDLVITPYASLLAVSVNPKAVLENLDALEAAGALGHFGYYESIDYTTSRLPVGQDKAIIKSYMAHHQGMIMVALANFLNPIKIVDRVHQFPRIQSTELLLQEQIPQSTTFQKAKEVNVSVSGQETQAITATPWTVDTDQPSLSAHVLSNGNLKMIMTESGSGYIEWNEVALTRWRGDAVVDPWGIWFYVQDLDQEKTWSIGRQPIQNSSQEYQVIFAPHRVEIRHTVDDVRMIMQSTIMPKHDVCLQRINLTNQSTKKRQFRVLSYGEVVLAAQDTDQQHPAFNKLFIESSYNDELNMLHFQRRKRSANENSLGMAHLMFDDLDNQVEYESDRNKFIGRGHNYSNPIAITRNNKLSSTVGITLDPIFSLGKRFYLEPNQTVTLTYMTIAANDQEQASTTAREVIKKFRIHNAFSSAQSQSEKLLRALGLQSDKLSRYQRLFSRIIYPVSELRPTPSVLNKNELGQSGLWPFGISGDYPILLVMIERQDEIEILQETLQAHTYWRKMGMLIDLVILNTKDIGYAHELSERIHQAINVMDSQSWINRRGGIFVLTASQIDLKALHLVKTAASVIIDTKSQDIEGHLQKAAQLEPHLPPFTPTHPDQEFSSDQSITPPDDLILGNGIGGFTPDGKEYQIYLEDYPKLSQGRGQITPAPWVNVIANESFGFLVSESGGGYTWCVNSGENRLTPWTNDPVSDPSGEGLYLRDEITGKIWSPTPYPAGESTDYLVKHGQGYTIFDSYNQGFHQIMKVFVDPEAPVKIIALTLVNTTDQHRRLTGTYFAEWVLSPNRNKSKAFIVVDYDNESEALMAKNPYSAEFSEYVAFLTSDQPVHGLTTDRREFLGSPGNRRSPAGLKRIGLSGNVKTGVDPCAAIQIHVNIKPKEQQKFTFILGQGADIDEAKQLAQAFSCPDTLLESWEKTSNAWDECLNTLQVETPEEEMDLMLNRWLIYQTLSSRIWGRSGFFQSSGAFGFRDQLQDVMSVITIKPELSRKHILRAARHQFEEGDVLHWWHPPSGRGVRTRITDDLMWLVYVTAEYVLKTGDMDILSEKVPFRVADPLEENEEDRYGEYETTEEAYTLFEHCRRALVKGDTQGPHDLPLIGGGDWNDGMNRVGIQGKGESVWLAWFVYENHKRFANLCEIMDDPALAAEHKDRAEQIREIINQVAWDGDWYLRGYYDDGTPLGSHHSEECQIDLLPQSWSVLTQGAPENRQKKAMEFVEKLLVQKESQLIRLFTPPFDKTKQDPGYIKGYPPGVRENGGQYTHAAIWAVWALAELGQGNKAYEQFDYLNPVTHSRDINEANRYSVEPYVVAADVYSTPPFIGRGGWTWYTGSSGWLYRLGTEAILGFKLEGNHIKIEPCIPKSWDGFKLRYRKNDCTYQITVKNPDHVETGIKRVSLNGTTLNHHQIPLQNDQKTHDILVIMG